MLVTVVKTAPEAIQEKLEVLSDGTFQFACHPGVPCFTECCRDLRLLLTPYDILRLKTHLHLEAGAFLAEYTESRFDDQHHLPDLSQDARGRAPALSVRCAGGVPGL